MPYKKPIKARAIALYQKGYKYAEIGRKLKVPASTVRGWIFPKPKPNKRLRELLKLSAPKHPDQLKTEKIRFEGPKSSDMANVIRSFEASRPSLRAIDESEMMGCEDLHDVDHNKCVYCDPCDSFWLRFWRAITPKRPNVFVRVWRAIFG